jgi:HemY protein
MKWLFSLVTWIVLAVLAAWFLDNAAMVSVFANGMRIDFSLNLLVVSAILATWLILTIYRVRHGFGRALREARTSRVRQAESRVLGLVLEALSLQLAGRHGRAQTAAKHAIERLTDATMADQSTLLILAHWVCAESAQAMRQSDQVQAHLDAALAVAAKDTGVIAQEGVRLRSIRWGLEARDVMLTRERLQALPKAVSRRVQVWRSKLDLALLDDQPEQALEAVRTLNKHGVFAGDTSVSLQRSLAARVLNATTDLGTLNAVWKALPEAERLGYDVALTWVAKRLALTDAPDASAAQALIAHLQPLWEDFAHLSESQQLRFVGCLEQLLPALPQAWLNHIEAAQREHPADGMLQFLAAKAYLQRELLGKAKTMFLAVTAAGVSNAIKRQAWIEIAQLEALRDDHDAAQAAWRSAALA